MVFFITARTPTPIQGLPFCLFNLLYSETFCLFVLHEFVSLAAEYSSLEFNELFVHDYIQAKHLGQGYHIGDVSVSVYHIRRHIPVSPIIGSDKFDHF